MPAKSADGGDKKIIQGVISHAHRKPVPAGIKRAEIRSDLLKER